MKTTMDVNNCLDAPLVPLCSFSKPEKHEIRHRSTERSSRIFCSFTAGAVTGCMEAFLTYPVEYVKTNMQLQQLSPSSVTTPHVHNGVWHCVKTTAQDHGPLGFYRGFTPLLLGSIPKQAFRWGAYEWATGCAKLLMGHGSTPSEQHKVTLSLPVVSACGFFAGCVEAVCVVGPTESLKTRLIHDARRQCPCYYHHGIAQAVRLMVRESGVGRTFYSGVGTTMLKQGLSQSLRFPLQKFIMDMICSSRVDDAIGYGSGGVTTPLASRQHERRRHSPFWNGVAGFCAGVLSVLVTQPVDVVKTHLQSGTICTQTPMHGGGSATTSTRPVRVSYAQHYLVIFRRKGIAGLYSGVFARSVHVGLHVALTFTIFPVVQRFFSGKEV